MRDHGYFSLSNQEVNQNVYDDFFKPNMEMQGYKGVYKRRTGEEKQDGCAIFYHAEKFELKKTLPIDFNRGVEILDRNNVALLIMLQPKKVIPHPQKRAWLGPWVSHS